MAGKILLLYMSFMINGEATYYGPGIMEQAAANRNLSLAGYEGGIEMDDCSYLGEDVWVAYYQRVTQEYHVTGRLRVVDCTEEWQRVDRAERGRFAEMNYELAQEIGMAEWGPWPVTVFFYNPIPINSN